MNNHNTPPAHPFTAFDWALFALTFLGLALLKWHYQQATVDDVLFLLTPVVHWLSWSSGDGFAYVPSVGFVNASMSVIIDKGCSGLNFWVIATALGVFTVIPASPSLRLKLMTLVALWALAWGVTLVANFARISIALWLHQHAAQLPLTAPTWLHEAIGVASYLIFLMIYHTLLVKYNERYRLSRAPL